MASSQQTYCCTDDQNPWFEGETEGFCETHCDLKQTKQDGTRLSIEIENLRSSTFYAYITLNSRTGDTHYHPQFVICRPLYGGKSETVEFKLWHNSSQTGVTDTIQVKIQYTRTWILCNGKKSVKTTNLQPMNLTLNPKFEYD